MKERKQFEGRNTAPIHSNLLLSKPKGCLQLLISASLLNLLLPQYIDKLHLHVYLSMEKTIENKFIKSADTVWIDTLQS